MSLLVRISHIQESYLHGSSEESGLSEDLPPLACRAIEVQAFSLYRPLTSEPAGYNA